MPRPVMVVAGARPNFMKVAPILAELERQGRRACFLHTGQHYSADMSERILDDLGIPAPDYNLGVGSGTHAQQTARVMIEFEPILLEVKPEWLVVVGDVNSTLACTLVAAKLRDSIGCRIAHVEAGLRSFDWRMPEEVNRVLTDRLADILFTPSEDAGSQLLEEGIPPERIVFAGNVMIDTLLSLLPRAREVDFASTLGLDRRSFAVATLHRPSNVDSPETLGPALEGLAEISRETPVVFPVHPRTRMNARKFGLAHYLEQVTAVEPVGYLQMLSLTEGARVVLTDSGGLQEETTALGIPCVTLREQTERPITISEGTNQMAEWPLSRQGIVESFRNALKQPERGPGECSPAGWDGKASVRIVQHILGCEC